VFIVQSLPLTCRTIHVSLTCRLYGIVCYNGTNFSSRNTQSGTIDITSHWFPICF